MKKIMDTAKQHTLIEGFGCRKLKQLAVDSHSSTETLNGALPFPKVQLNPWRRTYTLNQQQEDSLKHPLKRESSYRKPTFAFTTQSGS